MFSSMHHNLYSIIYNNMYTNIYMTMYSTIWSIMYSKTYRTITTVTVGQIYSPLSVNYTKVSLPNGQFASNSYGLHEEVSVNLSPLAY